MLLVKYATNTFGGGEACVCDHGFERSDLCAEIIIIIIIIITVWFKEKSECT